MTSNAHARLAPSSRFRWGADACPGSAREEARYVDRPNKYSIRGDLGHEIGAQCLKSNLDAKDWSSLDVALKVGAEFPEPTLEDLTLVQIYIDEIRSDLKIYPGELWIEKKVTISPDHWGTLDACIWCPDAGLLLIYDLKTGYHHVAVENNPQLKSYAVGAYNLINDKEAVDAIELVVIQPRGPGPAVQRWRVGR